MSNKFDEEMISWNIMVIVLPLYAGIQTIMQEPCLPMDLISEKFRIIIWILNTVLCSCYMAFSTNIIESLIKSTRCLIVLHCINYGINIVLTIMANYTMEIPLSLMVTALVLLLQGALIVMKRYISEKGSIGATIIPIGGMLVVFMCCLYMNISIAIIFIHLFAFMIGAVVLMYKEIKKKKMQKLIIYEKEN